jgi:hypothetical protein
MEFEECFGSTEKCSEDILEKLAKVTNESLRSKLNGEKIKVVAHRYLKPKNMHSLKTSTVNNEIWRHLDRNDYWFVSDSTSTSPSSFLFSDSDESMISSKSSLSLSLSSLSFLVFVLDVELYEIS